MKRFHFTLRPLAVLRAHRELRAREALALTARTCAEREAQHDAWEVQRAQFAAEVVASREGCTDAAQHAQTLAGYRVTCEGVATAARALAAARSELDQRQREFVVAHQELEVVKRFERRAREAHGLECSREEQAAFDEFASRRTRQRKISS